jgi:predicted DNA-binding protein YlxM (UPF0122 family)
LNQAAWSFNKKELLKEFIREILLQKQEQVLKRMQYLNESLANETKSSAGDKYETSREMINQEINQAEQQLKNVQNQLGIFAKTNFEQTHVCKPGALFMAGNYIYFWSVALGKIKFRDEFIMCFSSISPFAKTALDKKPGDQVGIGARKTEINWIT